MAFALLFVFAVLAILFFMRHRAKDRSLPPSPAALPIIGHLHLLGPLIHHSFRNISRRYGPLFYLRLGSVPCVVVSSPDLAREFLKSHEITFSSRKHSLAIQKLTYGNSSFAFSPLGPYWNFVKKMSATELLGSRMLTKFHSLRTKELHTLVHLVLEKSKAGEAVNFTQELLKLTNNVITQMMLSIRCSDTHSQAEEVRSLVREVTKLFGTFNVSDFIWLCKDMNFQGFRNKIDDVHKRYDALLEKIITERIKRRALEKNSDKTQGEESRLTDFLDIMLDAVENQNSEIELTRNHIKALILDFFTAATDTSAIVMDWALAELINHPRVLEKAQNEIDIVTKRKRLVEELDIHSLPYIEAIIKETLRLHPPIPMVARKSIQECQVRGYKIPCNSMLFINIWAIGRDSRYWERPSEFLPKRFLPGNGMDNEESSRDIKGHHFELLPFGTGRRGCPGISLAIQALPVMLAATIQCFDFKLVIEDENPIPMTEQPGLTAPRAHDLLCIPVTRLPNIDMLIAS